MTPGDHTTNTTRNPDGSLAVSENTATLTRFGRWLRRTSLDEIPQIFNILVGEMSFIGPRPDLPEHVRLYSEEERLKLRVRPGLTGLAQVMGRNDLPWPERLKLDVRYVREFSLRLDLRILLLTVRQVVSGKGVYQR
jgi:lipopolysaccharide/colanic/teichoic acid biosynthesis glycosyltransferase